MKKITTIALALTLLLSANITGVFADGNTNGEEINEVLPFINSLREEITENTVELDALLSEDVEKLTFENEDERTAYIEQLTNEVMENSIIEKHYETITIDGVEYNLVSSLDQYLERNEINQMIDEAVDRDRELRGYEEFEITVLSKDGYKESNLKEDLNKYYIDGEDVTDIDIPYSYWSRENEIYKRNRIGDYDEIVTPEGRVFINEDNIKLESKAILYMFILLIGGMVAGFNIGKSFAGQTNITFEKGLYGGENKNDEYTKFLDFDNYKLEYDGKKFVVETLDGTVKVYQVVDETKVGEDNER